MSLLLLMATGLAGATPAVVDRIEGQRAVVELQPLSAPDPAFVDLPLALLPPGTREGDRLTLRIERSPPRAAARTTPASGPQPSGDSHVPLSPTVPHGGRDRRP